MATFTTKLSLGDEAFGITGYPGFRIERLMVGQIRVTETHPKAKSGYRDTCYQEQYMCFSTGVGSGQIWTYGENIFATELEAEQGLIKKKQQAYEQIRQEKAYHAKQEKLKRERDLEELRRLKELYEEGISAS